MHKEQYKRIKLKMNSVSMPIDKNGEQISIGFYIEACPNLFEYERLILFVDGLCDGTPAAWSMNGDSDYSTLWDWKQFVRHYDQEQLHEFYNTKKDHR